MVTTSRSDGEREALIADAWTTLADADRCVRLNFPPASPTLHRRLREVTRALADAHQQLLARKHPEPEITAREGMTDFPVGTIARDMIGRVFVRTDAETYRWRTILGGGYDLSDEQATTYTPVRILWVPVGEGEQ